MGETGLDVDDAAWLVHWNGWWDLESRRDWDKFLNFQEVPAEAQEAAITTIDRHRYVMTKDTFSMLHSIPSKNFELNYSTPMDWEWHECPYPKPTAKLYGAGHNADAKEKTVWRHRWTNFPYTFETEIQSFIEGKSLRFLRGLASDSELKFEVFVLDSEGETSGVLVGPCLSSFRKDGAGATSFKISASKGPGFYSRAAEGILNGVPVQGGFWRRGAPRIKLHALGNAINTAAIVASDLECKGVGTISKIETGQVEIKGKSVAQILVHVTKKNASITSLFAVCGFSVLGTRMTMDSKMEDVSGKPDVDTVFVDPAGLDYIQRLGPAMAGGAAGAIYSFLGIKESSSFPQPVIDAIKEPLRAKFHAYGNTQCIHVVGPNFSVQQVKREEAIEQLAKAYRNVLTEFANSGFTKLRLLPVSGGIFAGPFMPELPKITVEALQKGFEALSPDCQQRVRCASRLEMCIFMEKEVKEFAQEFAALK